MSFRRTSGGGGGTAATTSFAPAAGIAATNVQAAIEEAVTDAAAYTDTEIAALSIPVITASAVDPGGADGTYWLDTSV